MRSCFLYFIFLAALPIFAQSETEKAVELYRKGKCGKAIRILKDRVEIDKNDRKAWVYLGGCYVKAKNNILALEAFKKAESLIPENPSAEEMLKSTERLQVISKPRAGYTDKARSMQIQGIVRLAIGFSRKGRIKFVFPVRTLPYGLTESSISAAKRIKFEPARKGEKPVSVIAMTTYNFTIY